MYLSHQTLAGATLILVSALLAASVSAADHIEGRVEGGDVSMIRPDGTVLGHFDAGKNITGPWGVAIDGNDNVWVASSISHSITQLCGVRPENFPPGLATGDPISPPGSYIDGLQTVTAVAIDPAGNAWVANSWN
ncbi:NHL repeat-containing protein [Adhaeretor mobilis]|uniref:NHL repeat protein n=1 Tax=Adhaeretor mobilis TaxID=1930276 RepID=A0A517N1B9_9BACT|nr:hypothetical protein [Adhaeretor mobilis]QDT00931.1 NHL repeat protein [Adhaeretor mobilis]